MWAHQHVEPARVQHNSGPAGRQQAVPQQLAYLAAQRCPWIPLVQRASLPCPFQGCLAGMLMGTTYAVVKHAEVVYSMKKRMNMKRHITPYGKAHVAGHSPAALTLTSVLTLSHSVVKLTPLSSNTKSSHC